MKNSNITRKKKIYNKFSSYTLDQLNTLYDTLNFRLKKNYSKKYAQSLLIVMWNIDKELDRRKFVK